MLLCRFIIKILATILAVMLILSGCSVYLANSRKTGDVNMMFACRTRTCLLTQGAQPIQCKRAKSGELTKELLKAHKPHNSVARASVNGMMDLYTLGLWELIATPVEIATLERQGIYFFQVDYTKDGETIQKMEPYSPQARR